MSQAAPSPLVSVIVTCHNLGCYIGEAVQSVLAQTAQDFEILIVDDGSDDQQTKHLLEGSQWPKTSVYRTENQGLARARNFLIERARGTYLCALDADDRLRPQYFEKALSAFGQDPELAFVSSWIQMFGVENRLWKQHSCDLATLLAEDTVMTAALVRRQLVAELGGYDGGMPAQGYEDWDLWIRIVGAGHRGTILPEMLFDYRRPNSMSATCVQENTHLQLVEYLMRKHHDLYASHWPTVLLRKETEIADMLESNRRLEREILDRLTPFVDRAGHELAEVQRRLDPAVPQGSQRMDQSSALRAELVRAQGEVRALRHSWSWRVTRPLRWVVDLGEAVSTWTRRRDE